MAVTLHTQQNKFHNRNNFHNRHKGHFKMRMSLPCLKYDLLKISEPFDGVLWEDNTADSVVKLFTAYLNDMRRVRGIYEFEISYTRKETSYTFDVNVRLAPGRSPKKLKIHVGIYQSRFKKAA